jgi:hypothetical protein
MASGLEQGDLREQATPKTRRALQQDRSLYLTLLPEQEKAASGRVEPRAGRLWFRVVAGVR